MGLLSDSPLKSGLLSWGPTNTPAIQTGSKKNKHLQTPLHCKVQKGSLRVSCVFFRKWPSPSRKDLVPAKVGVTKFSVNFAGDKLCITFGCNNETYQVIQFVTLSSPSWRSLNPLKGSLNHPKKVTLNHQVFKTWGRNTQLLLMVQKSEKQVEVGSLSMFISSIERVLYIPNGVGFLPSTVYSLQIQLVLSVRPNNMRKS